MASQKKAPNNVLIRSDRNLVALGLVGMVTLLGSMLFTPTTFMPLMVNSPAVANEPVTPQAPQDSFASEPMDYSMMPTPTPSYEPMYYPY